MNSPPGARDLHEVCPEHGDPDQWYGDQNALDEAVPTIEELGAEDEQQSERQRTTQRE